jgi:hypothetical protein
MYANRILPFGDRENDLVRHSRRILIVAPVLMIILFAWGEQQGEQDLKSFSNPYNIETKQNGSLHRVILRNFDKGILVRDPVEKHVEFIKWDDVTRVRRFAIAAPDQSLSCSWFGIDCPERPPIP